MKYKNCWLKEQLNDHHKIFSIFIITIVPPPLQSVPVHCTSSKQTRLARSVSCEAKEASKMLSCARFFALSPSPNLNFSHNCAYSDPRFLHGRLKSSLKCQSMAMEPDLPIDADSIDQNAAPGFCIIEGPETVQDFAQMQVQEIQDNIRSRRNKVFLLMEEIRRLRIQQRIRSAELGTLKEEPENELPNFPSFIPFLPPLSAANLRQYYASCFSLIAGIIVFGGLLAPALELKLGLGGTSYEDFIRSMHLPMQLSEVDPIVASFSGGAVGVISALMVVEINNVKQQEHKRCKYCLGTGYLACARCLSTGTLILTEPVATFNGGDQPLPPPKTERCTNCSGAGKVMCPTCLCTGMAMASEHDPRIDPFD